MGTTTRRAELAMAMYRERGGKAVASSALRHVYGQTRALGLRRDLDVPFSKPPAKIPVTIRPLRATEDVLFDPGQAEGPDAYEQRSRLQLLESGLGTCWAAVDEDDQVCYVQWLITRDQNALLHSYYQGAFPALGAQEALLEGAYTFPAFRGRKIMSYAMADIAERAAEHGARWVSTYCAENNVPSIKACRSAGFGPWVHRDERWRLLQSRYRFTELEPAVT